MQISEARLHNITYLWNTLCKIIILLHLLSKGIIAKCENPQGQYCEVNQVKWKQVENSQVFSFSENSLRRLCMCYPTLVLVIYFWCCNLKITEEKLHNPVKS